jgi:DNA primase
MVNDVVVVPIGLQGELQAVTVSSVSKAPPAGWSAKELDQLKWVERKTEPPPPPPTAYWTQITHLLDPDEFIRRDGAEAFSRLPALSPAVYRLSSLKVQHDLATRDGKLAYTRAAARIIQPLDPLERDTCIQDLAVETGFSRDVILDELRHISDQAPPPDAQGEAPPPARKISRFRGNDPASSSADLSAQETLLSLLATGQIPKDMVTEKDFEDEELKSIYVGLVSGLSPAAVADTAPDEESRARYVRILRSVDAESTDQLIAMAQQCLNRIRRASLQKQYDDLMKKIPLLSPGSPEIPSLLLNAQEIQRKLQTL